MSALRDTIAVTLDEAAAMCGVSKRTIQRAIDAGEMTPRYPHRYPVILVSEIHDWVNALPTSPPGR